MKNKKQTLETQEAVKNIRETIETITSPRLKKLLTKMKNRIENTPLAKDIKEFQNEIINAPTRQEQQVFSFLPHQLAKTSVFFPMSARELKEENRKISRIEHETGWGKIVIEGIKLAIFEEDIFLALIKIAKNNTKKIKDNYILHTNMKNIVNILYGSSGYTKKSFERIERALQHFQLIRFELTTYDWKKEGKERLRTKIVRSIGNIVASYNYIEKTKDLTITFNPPFFAYFLESMLTNINLTLRRKLKKDGSKALMRFLSTHNKPGQMHMLTVLNAINFNTNQPLFRLRSRIKVFIAELKKNKILGPKTKLDANDIIYFDASLLKKTLPD